MALTVAWPAAVAAEDAASPGPSRAELVNSWDLDKNGTIDESEAEIARAKMRRARAEFLQKSAAENSLAPDLGKKRPSGTPGKAVAPPPNHAVPKAEGDPLGEAFLPAKPPERKAEDETGRKPRKRDRELNAGRPRDGGRGEPDDLGEQGFRERDPGERSMTPPRRPATGGVRAGAPALRPGYGATGPKVDLNAGRLPAGLPPAQGMRPQVGSAPFRGGLPGTGSARAGSGSPARAGDWDSQPERPPLMPSSSSRVSAEDIGLP